MTLKELIEKDVHFSYEEAINQLICHPIDQSFHFKSDN